jgi:CBS domain-containing protein
LRNYFFADGHGLHQAYPVVDASGRCVGVLSRSNLLEGWIADALTTGSASVMSRIEPIIAFDLARGEPVTAYPWESCRVAAERMVEKGVGRLPIIATDGSERVIGIVTRADLLTARAKTVEEEMQRERLLLR